MGTPPKLWSMGRSPTPPPVRSHALEPVLSLSKESVRGPLGNWQSYRDDSAKPGRKPNGKGRPISSTLPLAAHPPPH